MKDIHKEVLVVIHEMDEQLSGVFPVSGPLRDKVYRPFWELASRVDDPIRMVVFQDIMTSRP